VTEFGYALSSEEHGPRELDANARKAEEAGFEFAMISDHFHPWTDSQGQSPFVWSVIGGIAALGGDLGYELPHGTVVGSRDDLGRLPAHRAEDASRLGGALLDNLCGDLRDDPSLLLHHARTSRRLLLEQPLEVSRNFL
jgi:hypothetical protein